jgi:hypothetical protein
VQTLSRFLRADYFRFGFYKKNNQTELFLKKNRFKPTGFGSVFWTKTGSNRFGSVFSGLSSVRFFWTKTGSNRFGSVFSGLSLVRFFRFQTYKTEPVRFFTIRFFQLFFFLFSRFNRFFSFFTYPLAL